MDLIITNVDRRTALAMAKEAATKSGKDFMDKYGVLWPMRYSFSVVATFTKALLDEMAADGRRVTSIEEAKQYITVDYIREMFTCNELPMDILWIGDTTMEMVINTFLTAFINDGHQEGIDDCDNIGVIEAIDGTEYTRIRGEMCKMHGPYKKWNIYRAWNTTDDHGKMMYFAVKDDEVLISKNLSGIKDRVTRRIMEEVSA